MMGWVARGLDDLSKDHHAEFWREAAKGHRRGWCS
jgi:hypothetical protein